MPRMAVSKKTQAASLKRMQQSPVDQLRAYLASVIARADDDKVPDGYADGVDPDSEFVSDWSVYLADKVLEALWDGGVEPGELADMLNRPRKKR
jgi:hypothetical protein